MTPQTRKHLGRLIVATAIVVVIFAFVLPAFASYGDAWDVIAGLTAGSIVVLVGLYAINLLASWVVRREVMPGLTLRRAALSNEASTAVSNTLPVGGMFGVGLTYLMYKSWGFSGADVARATVVSGIWNTFVKLGMPVVALLLLAVTHTVSNTWAILAGLGVATLMLGIVALWLIIRTTAIARRAGELAGDVVQSIVGRWRSVTTTRWGDNMAEFSTGTRRLLDHRWHRLTLAAIASHVSVFGVFLGSMRAVGVSGRDLDWIQLLAAFAIVRLISALPITPAGLGVAELGYVAALTLISPVPDAQILAAVLVFRFFEVVPPIFIGTLFYVLWKASPSGRRELAAAEAAA